jgi:hypothetical protein
LRVAPARTHRCAPCSGRRRRGPPGELSSEDTDHWLVGLHCIETGTHAPPHCRARARPSSGRGSYRPRRCSSLTLRASSYSSTAAPGNSRPLMEGNPGASGGQSRFTASNLEGHAPCGPDGRARKLICAG